MRLRKIARSPSQRRILVGAVVLPTLALLAVGSGLLASARQQATPNDGGSAGTRIVVEPDKATMLSSSELRSYAASLAHPVYWAGSSEGAGLEVTETKRGEVFVRYLTPGARAGDERPDFMTVGSYPLDRAHEILVESTEGVDMRAAEAPGGGTAAWDQRRSSSVYMAYPGLDVLVEVFDPTPQRARELVLSGEVGVVR